MVARAVQSSFDHFSGMSALGWSNRVRRPDRVGAFRKAYQDFGCLSRPAKLKADYSDVTPLAQAPSDRRQSGSILWWVGLLIRYSAPDLPTPRVTPLYQIDSRRLLNIQLPVWAPDA
ncbi:MAG: hypothetical protein U1F68_01985 [Gammaproteobacteria bacterium]